MRRERYRNVCRSFQCVFKNSVIGLQFQRRNGGPNRIIACRYAFLYSTISYIRFFSNLHFITLKNVNYYIYTYGNICIKINKFFK